MSSVAVCPLAAEVDSKIVMDVSDNQPGPQLVEWVIEPRREDLMSRLRDVWRYRRLMRFFATKSLEKMIRRTVLGPAWILIRPLFPIFVNTFIFGGVLGVGSDGIPYFLFVTTGSAIWELFSAATMWGTRSLDLNRGLMNRIYIPRLILPLATMTPAYLNFAIYMVVLAVGFVYYHMTTGVNYFTPAHLGWSLAALALSGVLSVGISLWTSVPAMQARDVRFTLGYVFGFWSLLTPVLYPLPTEKYKWLVALNPMTPVVNGFKYGVLGIGTISAREFGVSAAITLVVFVSGMWFFGRAEADAADKV